MLQLKIVTFLLMVTMALGIGMDLKEAEEILNDTLNDLAALDDPYYRISKINYATEQIVEGYSYKINADLLDTEEHNKTCDIEICARASIENGMQVTFKCPGEPNVVKRYIEHWQ